MKYAYADELFGFPRFPDNVREASKFPALVGESPYVPKRDEGYVFRKEYLRLLQFFFYGEEKNILLQGEMGTGKTTLIEQVAARLNWPVFAVGCHGGLEFQELIGRVTLQPDGSTGWADGPLTAAMRFGGIFLLDEFNFLKPEVAGGLNTALQATCLTIPETGEVIHSHPNFRIAATGNAVDGVGKSAYRGTQTQNIALLSRFTLGIRVKYMETKDEQKMLESKAPGIHPKVSEYLAQIAHMTRLSYEGGELASPMCPRETISCSKRLTAYSKGQKDAEALAAQANAMAMVLEMTFLFRWSSEAKATFQQAANQVAQRLGLSINLE